MSDEPQQVRAVDRGVTETRPIAVPVRIEAAAADLHHRAGPALGGQGIGSHLPGHCGGMVERGVEAAGENVQARVGGTGIGRAQRVELFDRAIRVHHDERLRLQAQDLHRGGAA